MQAETEERWRQLCEQAILEKDPDKLKKIIQEINGLLEAKEKRLASLNQGAKEKGAA
jgi:SMC interacting uncharacterized protein involved in chromosome segregation